MATLLLSAAGSALGGSIGGSVLGLSAASLGQAAGGILGSVIDGQILGEGSAPVEVGRARALRLQASTEGAPVPQVFGRMRVSGQVIWSTRFLENVRESTVQGGKATGGQRVREFSYSISFAVALCEGPIDRIGRIWADGQILDTQGLSIRLHEGSESQMPDPKIEAVEGEGRVPAYRGTAYVVFEDLPLEPYGNRIPQLNFEVFRSPARHPEDVTAEWGPELPAIIPGVAMSPGTGEHSIDPEPAQYVFPQGGNQFANVHNPTGEADFKLSLDQLERELPNCGQVSLIVSWFGSDLRCGQCQIEPKVEEAGRKSAPDPWRVAGFTSSTAAEVSKTPQGRVNFGGTPSDASVIRAIKEIKARGLKVMLYPFLLMDIPEENTLTNPYDGTEGQPVIPWRGRITANRAPGVAGSVDQTAAAADQVASFFGTASHSDFAISGETVTYSGPAELRWRRFILHMAALGAAAGGVEAICIGSEMRGLTTLRSDRTTYPAVDQFRALAGEVRQILPDAKISYAADWSEYFGHQPPDGSGDAIFHLDPLWADPEIDFIGIDDYLPLSDWRHEGQHLDKQAGAASIYELGYLEGNVLSGEYYDWFYASDADRIAQNRTPISDGAHGEPWVFRAKDFVSWWQNPHHNRIGGVREAQPTAWVPESKPIWLTETGCPAVDLGSNTPNLFFDPKSSESALPFASAGARDDEIQRRFLQAKLGFWGKAGNNPASAVYSGQMIPQDGIFVWTWDARPFPDFPARESVWADGPSHRLGHWLSGRVTSSALAEVVADICRRRGFTNFDVDQLYGLVDGYVIEETRSAREALQPLMLSHAFEAIESAGKVVFRMRENAREMPLDMATLVEADPEEGPLSRERKSDGAKADIVRLAYADSESDYRIASAEAIRSDGTRARTSETSLPMALAGSRAQLMVNRWLAESLQGEEKLSFSVPGSMLALEPGDLVDLPGEGRFRIDRIRDGLSREVDAVKVNSAIYAPAPTPERATEPSLPVPSGPVDAVFLDLPLPGQADGLFAVTADPWPGRAAIFSSPEPDGFELIGQARRPARVGAFAADLQPGAPNRWQNVSLEVTLPDLSGNVGLASHGALGVLNGRNRIAIELPSGGWEIAQFQKAELIGAGLYRLSTFLRGLHGTEILSADTLPEGTRFVLIDDALTSAGFGVAERGRLRHFRIGPAQFGFAHPQYRAFAETFEATALRPLPPAHLVAIGTLGVDIALGWVRQTRVDGDSWEGFEVPLGEERELYRVRIYAADGTTVLRQLHRALPDFTYTAAMQSEDGAMTGAIAGISQLSDAFGFGLERRITLDG